MQIGPKIDKIGACVCIAYITVYCFSYISRFLGIANVSSMPHMLRNLILMILLFYRTFYLIQKPRNVLNSIFQCKSSKPHEQPKQQCNTIFKVEPICANKRLKCRGVLISIDPPNGCKVRYLISIGPESDHCLPLSLTHSLTAVQ